MSGIERRALGSSGVEVSALGLGTVKIGRNRGMKYPAAFELPSDRVVGELLDVCSESGVTLIDTAPAYQVAEERLGAMLAARGDRDRWVISTKAGESFDGERSSFDFTPEAVGASVERSLRRLRTDRLDVVLVHSDGDAETRLSEIGTLDALRDLRTRGLVRAIGVSVKTEAGAEHCLGAGVDCLMVEYSPASPGMGAAIERCAALGVGVLIKKALASGHVDRISGGGDPVERALAFSLREPGVSGVVVGTINPDHLRSNIAAAERVMGAGR